MLFNHSGKKMFSSENKNEYFGYTDISLEWERDF